MVWPHLEIPWHLYDNSVWDSERSKKEKKTKKRWEDNMKEWTGHVVCRFPDRGKVERYCCNVICGAPTNFKVKGLRSDKLRTKNCLRSACLCAWQLLQLPYDMTILLTEVCNL